MTQLREAISGTQPCQWVEIDGARLAYQDTGTGLPVICLHAIGHGGGDFAALRRLAGDRYRFITLDWPGQGRSGPDTEPVSVTRYTTLVRGFLSALGIDRAVLLGNSIGGPVAITLAAHAPELVHALVLCDPGGLNTRNPFVNGFCRAMSWFFGAGARGARWFPRAFAFYYRRVLPEPSAATQRRHIVDAGYELAAVLRQAWAHFADPASDVRPLAVKVRCPVFFAWAKSDRVVDYRFSKAAVSRFPHHHVRFYTGGHAVFLEDPDAFAGDFLAFLQDIRPTENQTPPRIAVSP